MDVINYYESALKSGQKSYRHNLANNKDPYLPVLNELLPEATISSSIDAGLINVPAEQVIGTLTAGRSKSFAANFMPIEMDGSEFSQKWKSLALHQQADGIRDPVLLYEYMHRYYVQEGNKRVSVLKYFNAVTIPAMVRRILPEKSKDPKVIAYYEFLEFNRATRAEFLELTAPGEYAEFCELIGKQMGEPWEEELVRKIRSFYYSFMRVFLSNGGDKLSVSVGDALLACMRIYGYEHIYNLSATELKKTLNKVWEEISLQAEDNKIEMKLDPEEQPKKMISKLLAPKKLKVAFFHIKSPKESNWVASHEMGRLQAEEKLGSKIDSAVYICEEEAEFEEKLQLAIKDGVQVVFATSAEMLPACLRAAVDAPDVAIMNCSINKPHRSVRVYYPRMYEAKFVEGAIAGAISERGKIGYICKYPVYGSVAEINAFARGLKMTSPKAKLYLEWSSLENAEDATKKLRDKGITLISMRDYHEKESFRQFYGLELLENGETIPLVLPVWNWGVFYEWILGTILNGTYKLEKTNRSLLYHWGIGSEMIELLFSSKLPKEVRYLGEVLTRSVSEGICKPFFAPEEDENGRLIRDTIEQALSAEEILELSELEDNVIGSLPTYEDLNEQAQKLIDVIGLKAVRKASKKQDSAAAPTTGKETE